MKIEKLEAIRGFAAIYVVIHHFIGYSILKSSLHPLVRLPFRFGQEAVILFFLLSGFVIYLSVYNKPNLTFKAYFMKRFVRIYPILLVSFLISILIALSNNYSFTLNDLKNFAGNLFMLQDTDNKPGTFMLPFLDNSPLWSLSYEWWFYMLFFPLLFLRKKIKSIKFIYIIQAISIVGWLLYLMFPNHIFLILAYFIIWWAGIECARIYIRERKFNLNNISPILLALLIMVILSAIPIVTQYIKGSRNFSQIMYPILSFRHYLFSIIILFLGLCWWHFNLIYFDTFFGWFAKLSPISYAIYIIHFPFIFLKLHFIENPYLALIIKLVLVFSLAYFLECKMQPVINKLAFKKK